MSSTENKTKARKTPETEDVKNLPAGACLQRRTDGVIEAFFSYPRLPSGKRPRKYIGKVFSLIFYPDPEFQAFPEQFPTPIPAKPGRKTPGKKTLKPAASAKDTTETASTDQESQAAVPPATGKNEAINRRVSELADGAKEVNRECGVPALLLAAAEKEMVLEDLKAATLEVFGVEAAVIYLKILSVALFIAGNGYSMQRIDPWCDLTLCPKKMASQRVSELFGILGGRVAELKAAFCRHRLERFGRRCHRRLELRAKRDAGTLTAAEDRELKILGETEFVAHDGTKLYCDSDHISLSQFGVSKEGEFRRLVSLSLLYSEHDGIPLNYELRPGNASDMHTLDEVLDLWKNVDTVQDQIRTIVDRGYASRDNLIAFSARELPFLVAAKMNHSYMKAVKDEHAKELVNMKNYSIEFRVYGITVPVEITKNKKVYAHLFFDEQVRTSEKHDLMVELEKYCADWNLGKGRNKVKKSLADCFFPAEDGEVPEYNWDAIQARIDETGFFGMISTDKISCWKALAAYKTRNGVEIMFRAVKGKGNMRTARVHNDATLQGKMFVSFIALTMMSSIDRRLRLWKINPNLDMPNEQALNRNYSYGSLLDKMKSIRVVMNDGGDARLEGVTAKLKQLAEQLGLKDTFVLPAILNRMA